MNARRHFVSAACLLVVTSTASATALKVPADFATIQAAVDAANPGDEIVISKGTYPESVSVAGKSDLTLRGKGKATISGATALVPLVPVALLALSGCTNVSVKNVRVTAPADAVEAIDVSSCVDCRLESCRITGSQTGIGTAAVTRLSVTNCTISDVQGSAMSMSGDSAVVSGCTIKNPTSDAIFTSVTEMSVEGNTIEGALSGITFAFGPEITVVTDNTIDATTIGIAGNANGVVIDNHVKKCGRGVVVNADGGAYLHNSIKKSTTIGVEIHAGASDNLIAGNTAKKSGQFDLSDASGGANDLIDNQFTMIAP